MAPRLVCWSWMLFAASRTSFGSAVSNALEPSTWYSTKLRSPRMHSRSTSIALLRVCRQCPRVPSFETDRITPQYVTIGVAPWSAATIAAVETSGQDETRKNELCPPVAFTGEASSLLPISRAGIAGLVARSAEPGLSAWTEHCRLNPAREAAEHLDDPKVQEAFNSLAANIGSAMENLEHVLA